MANQEHLELLRALRVETWNEWRKENFGLRPDLRGVNLSAANLKLIDFSGVNLRGSNLSWADLRGANLRGANLSSVNFSWANLSKADLSLADLGKASLKGANLGVANLGGADLRSADLTDANLWCSQLSGTNLEKANLMGCLIYGISGWNIKLEGANQSNLIITPANELTIAVDNLEVAQFIGLLLNNHKFHDVINSISSKVVLILGHFTPERQELLDEIRAALRCHDYLPVLFNFNKPASRNIAETVKSVASMARFAIADFTDAPTIPQVLHKVVPNLPSMPVQPLVHAQSAKYDFDFNKYPWVLKTYNYNTYEEAIAFLNEKIIASAEAKAKELLKRN